tara:strand:+ start:138 stop:347 length:210 start_codon:yes stop_codon:yes gene_type:complete
MKAKINNKAFMKWLEDIWEEIEIQFYGITGAIFFFVLMYFFFHPIWMKPLVNFLFIILIHPFDQYLSFR